MFHGIFGCRYDLSGYPTIIVDFDDRYYVVINSNADPSLAPKDKASVTNIDWSELLQFSRKGNKRLFRKKRELAEILIKKAERLFPT